MSEKSETTYVFLGNHDAVVDLGQGPSPVHGKQRTEIFAHPDRDDVDELFADITDRQQGIWALHAQSGAKPAWVASNNAELADRLARHFDCEVRDPKPAGERDEHAERPSIARLLGPLMSLMIALPLLLMLGRFYLRTAAGTDWQSDLMGNAAGVPAKYMALSATSGESTAHTSLAGEITTAGGGLIRKAATYAHTTGTSTYTLTATFTANGTDSLPVSVVQIGLFTASSAGTMAFEKTVTSATFTASGDAVTYTYTVTP